MIRHSSKERQCDSSENFIISHSLRGLTRKWKIDKMIMLTVEAKDWVCQKVEGDEIDRFRFRWFQCRFF